MKPTQTNQIINSIEQNPCSDADNGSQSKNSLPFVKCEGSSLSSEEPIAASCLEPETNEAAVAQYSKQNFAL
jgi:hypothetical protein